jgi:hypothetical protein
VRATSILAVATILAVSAGVACGFASVLVRVATIPAAESSSEAWSEGPDALALARAFTAALDGHDVEALVAVFTEEDAGPTVTADRSAWQKFEIRLWAERQVRANIDVEAHAYWLTDHGAAWDAEVYRDDWAALGVDVLPVTNSVWVHAGKLADFTSTPRDRRLAERLGDLWRPGAAPERPAS